VYCPGISISSFVTRPRSACSVSHINFNRNHSETTDCDGMHRCMHETITMYSLTDPGPWVCNHISRLTYRHDNGDRSLVWKHFQHLPHSLKKIGIQHAKIRRWISLRIPVPQNENPSQFIRNRLILHRT
jgi:hypothetical protein